MSIKKVSEELTLDVLINFQGIEDILKEMSKKIKNKISDTVFKIEFPEDYNFDELKKLLIDIQNKIETLPKEKQIVEIKETVSKGEKKVSPIVENLRNFTDVSPKGSELLTDYAIKSIDRLIKSKFDERKTDFTEAKINKDIIRKLYRRLKKGNVDEARALAKELIGKGGEETIKHMEKIMGLYKRGRKDDVLTETTMISLLEREQRKQRNITINPFYETKTIKTVETFRKTITKDLKNTIEAFYSNKISVEEFKNFIAKRIEEINIARKEIEKKKTLSGGRKEEVKDIATQTETILKMFSSLVSNVSDEEKAIEITKKLYGFILENKDLPKDFVDMAKEITKEIISTDTINKLVSLTVSKSFMELVSDKMKSVLRKKTSQKYMEDTMKTLFKKMGETIVIETTSEVNKQIVEKLVEGTGIDEATKKFKEEYKPHLEDIMDTLGLISDEKVKTLEKASKFVKKISGEEMFGGVNIKGLTDMFKGLSAINPRKGTSSYVTNLINELDEKKETMFETLNMLSKHIKKILIKKEILETREQELFTTVTETESRINAIKQELKGVINEAAEKFKNVIPDEDRIETLQKAIKEADENISKTTKTFDTVSVKFGVVKAELTRLKTNLNSLVRKLGNDEWVDKLAESVAQKLDNRIASGGG